MARKRKKGPSDRDMFARSRGKGTEITITIDSEFLHIIDAIRSDVEEKSGVEISRRQALEGLMRKVWRDKFYELSALEAGKRFPDSENAERAREHFKKE